MSALGLFCVSGLTVPWLIMGSGDEQFYAKIASLVVEPTAGSTIQDQHHTYLAWITARR
jgi:hypothetical protein